MREITNFAAGGHQPPVVRKPNRVSVPEVATAQGDPDSLKRRLAELNPSGTISVELPFQGNGFLHQARTSVSGLVFYGRASTEDEAVVKCCKKAINHIMQQKPDPNANCLRETNRHEHRSAPLAVNGMANGRRHPPPPPPPSQSSTRRDHRGSGGVGVIGAGRYHPPGHAVMGPPLGFGNQQRPPPQPLMSLPSARPSYNFSGLEAARNRRCQREQELRSEMGGVLAMLDKFSGPSSSSSSRGLRQQPAFDVYTDKANTSPRHNKQGGGGRQPRGRGGASGGHYQETSSHYATTRQLGPSGDTAYSAGAAKAPSPPPPPPMAAAQSSQEPPQPLLQFEGMSLKQIPIKNAVMMLNEMFPPPKAPQYKVTSQTGPPNNPTFTMVCTIEDRNFPGEGKSKKEAKLSCSQKAIEAIVGTSMSETKYIAEQSNPRASCDLDDWMELEGKNPVSILNELYPGIQYQLLSTSGPSHAPNFIIKASLNEMSAEGSGKSKKDAKLNASKALLVLLHKVGFDPMTGDMMSTQQDNANVASGHSFADQIGQLVTSKYQSLFGSTTYSKRRVMAGVVVTKNFGDVENGEVVCVSSGTKCINGEQLSLEGCVINDSHAEIVTRRCLMVYLYKQLEILCPGEGEDVPSNPDESIFQKTLDASATFLYELKEGIEFHLFITTSPCGDARIFSLHENSNKEKSDKDEAESNKDEAEAESTKDEAESTKDEAESTRDEAESTKGDEELSPSLDVNGNKDEEVGPPHPADEEQAVTSDDTSTICGDDEASSVKEDTGEKTDHGRLVIPTITITDYDASEEELAAKKLKARERVKQTDSSKGMLRSKIECGMGTVPIGQRIHLQTWDGVMSGDRLLTMACSDKILRWNVVGIQGALLTHLIRPVYLSSITVGSKFHPGHMKRALYERIERQVTGLPRNYGLKVPQLYATTSPETRQATKAHDYSVNWVVDSGQAEIVNGSTGKTISDNTSRLSKRSLFERFLTVSQQLMSEDHQFARPARYSEVKALAVDYQEAKAEVSAALVKSSCGHWVEKPLEQDQFSL